MTEAEYNDKIAKLDKAIASAATPEREKEAMKALKAKLESKKAELVKDDKKKPDYDEWEREVTDIIAEKLNAPNGDAQGIMEAQHFYVTQAWGQGLDAKAAAKQILDKSAPKKPKENKSSLRPPAEKGRGFFGLDKGEKITDVRQLSEGDIILGHSKQFDANNTYKITQKRTKPVIALTAVYWNPTDKKRIGAEDIGISQLDLSNYDYWFPKKAGNIKNEDEFADKLKKHVKESFGSKTGKAADTSTAAKKESPYDCDNLIEKEKQRIKRNKEAAAARAAAPKLTPATKNKKAIERVSERVMANVQKRIDKGEVKRPELEKLIKETEEFLSGLKASLKKL